MKYPEVKFKIDKELDKKMCLKFLNVKAGGIDFGKSILQVHPELRQVMKLKNKREKIEYMDKYFDNYYKKYSKMLKSDLLTVNKE
ncbi:MAG: hypothetical protein WC422_02865 [Candidatus Paceibacterota bacterium]|jgi:hypothetical protein